ncbi:TetR/AcrR family transcriptional regulator [Sphingomonas sp. LH128]|jgi:AcrR family transcriptional regulator|uniref:TetR/AcrR family transcriptional regulator n=1 Tax=Sphingomonas sp. LH128 TaxID=473781 RepID=UPI00027CA331|nr:TetR/AcrR family transcriptional regulator [Sphingomonas sp. LH128]EJU13429.1 TetR/AcrR family transcriptional regulator [Sphingomonas sp. LH128]
MTRDTSKSTETRPIGRPSVEDAAKFDEAIMIAARQVLFEQGEAATVNAVAQAAGLSRKSVYARYSNRTDLFAAAIRYLLVDVGPVRFEQADSFEESLFQYLLATLELVSGKDALTFQRILALNPSFVSDLRADMMEATRKIFFSPLVALLDAAARSGEIACEDVQDIAGIIIGGALARHVIPDPEAYLASHQSNEKYARQMSRMIAGGLVTSR